MLFQCPNYRGPCQSIGIIYCNSNIILFNVGSVLNTKVPLLLASLARKMLE